MAKMLDVLEAFLNLHGHVYMRLDGSTKPEQRQVCVCVCVCCWMQVLHRVCDGQTLGQTLAGQAQLV